MALPLRVDRLELRGDGRGVPRAGGAAVVVGTKYAGVEGVKSLGGDLVKMRSASTVVRRAAVAGIYGRQVLLDDLPGIVVGSGDRDLALGVVGEQVEGHGVGVLDPLSLPCVVFVPLGWLECQ